MLHFYMTSLAICASLMSTLSAQTAWACASQGKSADQKDWLHFKKAYRLPARGRRVAANPIPPRLPFPAGTGQLAPWGGTNAAGWRPEAIMANATSQALNEAWALSDVTDVSVAVPTAFSDSGFHPYGDGQSNSKISFNNAWGQPRPQLVATLIQFRSSAPKVRLRFDRTLQRDSAAPEPSEVEIYYLKNGAGTSLKIPLRKDSSGDFLAEWTDLPGSLNWTNPFNNNAVIVRPQPSYNDWFPVFFRHPVKTADSLIQAAPPGRTKFTGGMSGLTLIAPSTGKYQDPLKIGAQSAGANTRTPFENLMSTAFPAGYNSAPYNPQNIHAEYGSGGIVTGVGQGWTWVAEDKQARPFKIMYTCFERRNPQAEAIARDGGVASGGGWHSINNQSPAGWDAPVANGAEIIMNTLEQEPLVVAAGFVNVLARSGLTLPNNGVSYGLSDVAVVRWLKPGEGFITTSGINHPNHHWYFFSQNREVCTEEWVGQCGVEFACQ